MREKNLVEKYRLHPIGGYADDPAVCKAIEEQQKQWVKLTPKQRKIALRQHDEMYPRTSNQDGR
jgi:hypothetical protein